MPIDGVSRKIPGLVATGLPQFRTWTLAAQGITLLLERNTWLSTTPEKLSMGKLALIRHGVPWRLPSH